MRESEFKAKRVDDGEWVYGSYTAMREDDRNECFRSKPHKIYHRIWQWESGDWDMGGYANYEVIPETVCQWTGLKDKNGVKIYEGDICNFCNKIGVIVWLNYYASYGLREYKEGQIISDRYPLFRYYELEVIGNIHDKAQQKQSLIDMMRGDEEIGLYDDNPKNH